MFRKALLESICFTRTFHKTGGNPQTKKTEVKNECVLKI